MWWPGDWEAHIVDQPLNRTKKLYLVARQAEGRLMVNNHDGSWVNQEEGIEPTSELGWDLPAQAWYAIVDLAHPDAGHRVEVRRLEEALRIEQNRVDRLLDATIRGINQPPGATS